jgi:hypothetical protein
MKGPLLLNFASNQYDLLENNAELSAILHKSALRPNHTMKPEKKLSTTTLLSAMLAMSSLAGAPAFASVGNDTNATMNNSNTTAETTTTNATAPAGNETTAAAASNASEMTGVIASIQQDNEGNPEWITAGNWWLESNVPLIGSTDNATEPQINNFTANLTMVSNTNGTGFHPHEISNFNQTAVQHQSANSTTVAGTFTVTLEEGPVDNVIGYIHIVNDKLEFWVDPGATDNHFGPTTITGIVLEPRHMADNMTMTQGANMTESGQQ